MFINFTNHPSGLWSKAQLDAASTYGKIVDLPFPNVPPQFLEEEVQRMAAELKEASILQYGNLWHKYRLQEKK